MVAGLHSGLCLCRPKLLKRGGGLLLIAAAITLLFLDTTPETFQQLDFPLMNRCNDPDPDPEAAPSPAHHTPRGTRPRLPMSVGKKCEQNANDEDDTEVEDSGEDGLVLPTNPGNQHLYQPDAVLALNTTWTEETRTARMSLFKARQARVREVCRRTTLRDIPEPDHSHVLDRNLVWVTSHRLVWCPVFKAGSTTWVKNLLVVSGKTDIHKRIHATVRHLYPSPATFQERTRTLRDSMRMMVVRHPFERLLSAYRDKMLRVRDSEDPFLSKQQIIAHSHKDPRGQPIPYTEAELNVTRPTNNSTNLVHPTFTQFLKTVRDDVRGLWKNRKGRVNGHWQPFWINCDPCRIDYDVIAHIETLMQDQEFVIRELGLQDLLKPAHTHASRFDSYNNTSEAARTYFRQVPLTLIKSLAALFRPDFELFGYSPDEYFALAAAQGN